MLVLWTHSYAVVVVVVVLFVFNFVSCPTLQYPVNESCLPVCKHIKAKVSCPE